MKSLWLDTAQTPAFAPLEGDAQTDVLVIGGGLCGLLCAYMLRRDGVNCILIEADRLMNGTSGRTTAKITAQHGLFADRMIRRFGEERSRMYVQANLEALEEYGRLCAGISCDYQEKDSYVYSAGTDGTLERELHALERLGVQAQYCASPQLPVRACGAIRMEKQAQFHPVKFAAEIAKGMRIYEHTAARELIGTTVITDRGRIRAEKVILATHFPIVRMQGLYFMKMYQSRSYVLAIRDAPPVDGMYRDAQEKGFSFRMQDGLLLIGGGAHRTGKKSAGWDAPAQAAGALLSEGREAYRWASQDCMTLDGIPYIGCCSPAARDIYVATGFNKWGMTSSMLAARMLCDIVQGRKNAYEPVFSPSRSMLRPQLAGNLFESAIGLVTPTKPRCPHLGCALKWNAHEHTWDCPCHGSRFDADGNLLNTPAENDLPDKRSCRH